MSDNNQNIEPTTEQVLYADVLAKGMYAGLLLMIMTFALYVFGIMEPAIPLNEIANYWNMPVHEYQEAINQTFLHREHVVTGWSWLGLINKGDFVNFIPIAMLSGVTIICYIAVAPGMFRRGDKAYGIICILEVLILSLAASGLLTVGH